MHVDNVERMAIVNKRHSALIIYFFYLKATQLSVPPVFQILIEIHFSVV
jgi:hypothetical protein